LPGDALVIARASGFLRTEFGICATAHSRSVPVARKPRPHAKPGMPAMVVDAARRCRTQPSVPTRLTSRPSGISLYDSTLSPGANSRA